MNYMQYAYDIAIQGEFTTFPNPMVGAVLVHNEKIIGEGYHKKYGDFHAEYNCIKDAKEKGNGYLIKDSVMYVTLEPCNHHGKTPPCLDLILREGIKEVHVSVVDPNPQMKGKSIDIMRQKGIEVFVGELSEIGLDMNRRFIHSFTSDKPYVMYKAAMTLDGKIASHTNDSRWISSESSRKLTHKMRMTYCGLLTTYMTVNNDNPRMDVRYGLKGKNPIPIIVDRNLKVDTSKVIFDVHDEIIIVTSKDNQESIESGTSNINNGKTINKIKFIYVDELNGELNLEQALIKIRELGIKSVMIECGSSMSWSLIKGDLIDEYVIFIAPKLVGGKEAYSIVGGQGFDKISDSRMIEFDDIQNIDVDLMIRGKRRCSQE